MRSGDVKIMRWLIGISRGRLPVLISATAKIVIAILYTLWHNNTHLKVTHNNGPFRPLSLKLDAYQSWDKPPVKYIILSKNFETNGIDNLNKE